jgi:stress-induced morphogen
MPLENRLKNEPPKEINIYDELRHETHIKKAGSHFGGEFFRDHKLGIDRVADRFS